MYTGTEVSMEGKPLTAEMIEDTNVERTMVVNPDTFEALQDELSAERAAVPAKHPHAFGRGRNGFRNVGVRKLNLVNELAKTISRLAANGVNTDYVMKKFTDWKGPIRTPTKTISGIISQVKAFEN